MVWAVLVALLLSTTSALSHDSWINQGQYQDRNGIACCGANDCHIVTKITKEITGGFRVDGIVTLQGNYGIEIHESVPYSDATPSEDDDFHMCGSIYGGGTIALIHRRCFFAPQKSF